MSLPQASSFVSSSVYYDYGQSFGKHWQWPISSNSAPLLIAFIGIITTIAAERLFRLILKLRDWLRDIPHDQAVKKPTSAEGRGWTNLRHGIYESIPGRIALGGRGFFARFWDNFRDQGWLPFLSGIACLIWYVAFQIAGVASALLQDGSLVLASSPDCGYYAIPPNTNNASRIAMLYERSIQEESARLAENCYGKSSVSPECTFFLDTTLDFDVSNADCPFDPELCLSGSQPIRITTNAVDARVLGINAPETIEFNRTAICSPLNMNETYIRPIHDKTRYAVWGYYYGSALGTYPKASFASYRDYGTIGDVATYNLGAVWAPYSTLPTNWQPINGLRPTSGTSVTVLFVVSQKVFYDNPRDDPIFPAHGSLRLEVSKRQVWFNNRGEGTVMACKEWNGWRAPGVSKEWSTEDLVGDISTDKQILAGAIITVRALKESNIHNIINRRLETALKAQTEISSFLSLPLAEEQWKVEAEQLFRASVARMHLEVRDNALGSRKPFDGFVREEDSEKLCDGIYLFNAAEWSTINWSGFLAVVIITAILFVAAIPWGDERLTIEIIIAAVYLLCTELIPQFWDDLVQKIGGKWNDFKQWYDDIHRTIIDWLEHKLG